MCCLGVTNDGDDQWRRGRGRVGKLPYTLNIKLSENCRKTFLQKCKIWRLIPRLLENSAAKLKCRVFCRKCAATDKASVDVVESIVECELLQCPEQLGVHELARVRLNELVQAQLASFVHVYDNYTRGANKTMPWETSVCQQRQNEIEPNFRILYASIHATLSYKFHQNN